MSNLFSVFSPLAAFHLPLNWLSSFLTMGFLVPAFWFSGSILLKLLTSILAYVNREISSIFDKAAYSGLSLLPISFFLMILLNNFFGLMPYVFTSSSHLTFAVALALPLWLGHVLYGWLKTPKDMLAHLVPVGTPAALMPFMVLIELVSTVIRPLTLSVRLAANMIAGHLLMVLLSSQGQGATPPAMILLMVALGCLVSLEVAVSFIQSYVFSVLSTLYFSELSMPKLVKALL